MFAAAIMASMAIQHAPSPPIDENCLDDNLTDRCSEDVQASVREALGLQAIEAEAASGAEIYRASFVDGYGNDMPTIAFERRPGQAPRVVVYGRDDRSMDAPVSAELWASVRSESVFADREIAPLAPAPAPGAPPPPSICLHSWVQTIELSNSMPGGREIVPVRRRTEDACNGGLTTRFAFRLADMAAEALAPCDALDVKQQRNQVTLLATCLSLSGDRLTAAQLRNARSVVGPRPGLDRTDAGAWRAALGTNGSPRLDWGGTRVWTDRGSNNNVADFLAARVAENPGLRFEQRAFEGIDARRGAVTGAASGSIDGVAQTAPYRQVWIWDPNLSEWMLESWDIEPFSVAN